MSELLYFTLLLSPFIVGMLRHDREVRREQIWDDFWTNLHNRLYDI